MLLSDVDRHEVGAPSEFWWLQLLHQFHLRSSILIRMDTPNFNYGEAMRLLSVNICNWGKGTLSLPPSPEGGNVSLANGIGQRFRVALLWTLEMVNRPLAGVGAGARTPTCVLQLSR